MSLTNLIIQICDVEDKNDIRYLGKQLGIDVIVGQEKDISQQYSIILRKDSTGLSLLQNTSKSASPTKVDFLDHKLAYRRRTAGKSQGIARAVGVKKLDYPSILDATAGLGKDALILASLGCSVTLLERSPVVHAMLLDGFVRARASEDSDICNIIERMHLINIEALLWFEKIRAGEVEQPDVIFIDPMFPPRKKSARVKKDIFMLQQILPAEENLSELLRSALDSAGQRLVVKRPGSKTINAELQPDFQVQGKASHFDIYLTKPVVRKLGSGENFL